MGLRTLIIRLVSKDITNRLVRWKLLLGQYAHVYVCLCVGTGMREKVTLKHERKFAQPFLYCCCNFLWLPFAFLHMWTLRSKMAILITNIAFDLGHISLLLGMLFLSLIVVRKSKRQKTLLFLIISNYLWYLWVLIIFLMFFFYLSFIKQLPKEKHEDKVHKM